MRTKTLRLQTEYMDNCRARVTLHSVPMYIKDDHVGDFFTLYDQVDEVAWILSKSGVPTGDFLVQVILDRSKFQEIPDILMYRGSGG